MSRVNVLYKITVTVLLIVVTVIGFNWITTPHLSPSITLKCKTPETPDQIIKIVIVRETYGTQAAYRPYNFAQRFAGFSGMTRARLVFVSRIDDFYTLIDCFQRVFSFLIFFSEQILTVY